MDRVTERADDWGILVLGRSKLLLFIGRWTPFIHGGVVLVSTASFRSCFRFTDPMDTVGPIISALYGARELYVSSRMILLKRMCFEVCQVSFLQ
jgi:hypothetical protein